MNPSPEKNLVLQNEKGSFAPYLIGWLLGVPASLLFLVAIVRAIF